MPLFKNPERRAMVSWALYDWANSAFATTVIAGFFPVFFKEYWRSGVEATQSTLELGLFNSLAGVLVALSAPALGAIADRGGAKKRFLGFFLLMGVVSTAALWLIGPGGWIAAGALFALGMIGFAAGNVFYDSLLISVSTDKNSDFVSALGYAMGYLGGGALFTFNVLMTRKPHWFGLADAAQAVRLSFVMVAVWWGVFALPLFLNVREPRMANALPLGQAAFSGLRQIAATFREARKLRMVLLFLAGYFIYIDGVDTIIRMAVDYGLSIGFRTSDLILALLITQFVGFPSAIVFGKLGQKIGAKRGILIGLAVYMFVTFWGYRMRQNWEFYALAIMIGLVQGGVQSLSRSFYTRLIPRDKAGEFFGFYNMLGKFAAVIGPALMGVAGRVTGDSRMGILAILILFVTGGALLLLVNEEKGRAAARALEAAG